MPPTSTQETLARFFLAGAPAGLVSAYLYGSAARGAAHRDSDVDVAVLLDRSRYPDGAARADLRVRLGAQLVHALGANDIDLIVLNDVPPGLGRHAVVDGTRVFVADPEADHAFVRDVQLRAADLEPFLRRMRRLKLEALSS